MQPVGTRGLEHRSSSGRLARALRDVAPHAMDLLIALALSAAGIAIMVGRPAGGGDLREDDLLGAGLLLAQTLPLALRRVAPLGVLLVIDFALVAHSAAGYQVVQAGTFSSLIATFSIAALTDNRRSLIAAVVTVVAVAGFFVTNNGDIRTPDIAAVAATWAVAWVAGTFVRLRGEQADLAGARAARLELESETNAREAVAAERARMARELHDIVGHALNVIVIQAAGASRVYDTRPEVPREALASIETTGREALSEMERMLGVLTAATAADDGSGPQPGLAQLESLAAHVTRAGIPVDVSIEGTRPEVPASVDLSAYRIVQEALTNCLKHSGASRASVTVRYSLARVEVEVVDNGHGSMVDRSGSSAGGRGHVGMRERVALFGGEISIGPVSAEGGFRVRARLPFKATAE